MAEAAKTVPTRASVEAFLRKVPGEERRRDCEVLVEMMSQATGARPVLWGDDIVGFGAYHYVYASGREGDWPLVGFSPRKSDLSLYIVPGLDAFAPLLSRLGRHRAGKSCLYVKRLDDVDLKVLCRIVKDSVAMMAAKRTDK